MARRGRETLRFGPMKPVGLPDPRTGPGAACGGAAPAGGPRRADVEPGRLPDPAADPGAAAGVPRRFPAWRTPSSCATGASTATATSTARPALGAGADRAATTTGSSSPASSPASRGTPSRWAPGCWRGSTSPGGSRASRPRCRRRPRCWAGSTATFAEADPAHFQPMNANFGLLDPLPGKVKKDAKKAALVDARAGGVHAHG